MTITESSVCATPMLSFLACPDWCAQADCPPAKLYVSDDGTSVSLDHEAALPDVAVTGGVVTSTMIQVVAVTEPAGRLATSRRTYVHVELPVDVELSADDCQRLADALSAAGQRLREVEAVAR